MDFIPYTIESYTYEHIGAGSHTHTLPPDSKIIHIDVSQSGTASNSYLDCGNGIVARNYAKDMEVDLAYKMGTSTTCTTVKTGNDSSTWVITYTTYQTSPTSTPQITVDNSTELTIYIFMFSLLIFFFALRFFSDQFRIERYD